MTIKGKKKSDGNFEDIVKKIADHHDDNCYEVDIRKIRASQIANAKIDEIPGSIRLMITGASGNLFLGEDLKGRVNRYLSIPIENWHHTYSLDTYTKKMVEILKAWQNGNNIEFENLSQEDEYYDISYYISPEKGTRIKGIFAIIENLEKELVGHTDLALSKGSIDKRVLKDETKFSLNVLLPLFRSMSYQNVQYNHGPHEFGKDIIFSDTDKLGIVRNFGVQIKTGDMTGEAGSDLDFLIGQIDDALKITYIDIYSRERKHITDLIIAISGKFTGNAPQKICEKAHGKNVHFLDIDKIQELIIKYLDTNIE